MEEPGNVVSGQTVKSLEYHGKDVSAVFEDFETLEQPVHPFFSEVTLWQRGEESGETEEQRSETKIWHDHPKPKKRWWEKGAERYEHSGREINRFLVPGWVKSESKRIEKSGQLGG